MLERPLGRGGEVVEATADDPGREPPQRDVVDQLARPTPVLPAAPYDRDRREHRQRVTEAVHMQRQRADVEDVGGRARDRAGRHDQEVGHWLPYYVS
jgi:hypothetical protein